MRRTVEGNILFSQRLPMYPCRQEQMLFLIHTPPFLQGGVHTAGGRGGKQKLAKILGETNGIWICPAQRQILRINLVFPSKLTA